LKVIKNIGNRIRLWRKGLKIFVLSLLLVLIGGTVYVYFSFNRLISNAIVNTFNSNVVSDVYDLSFEHLDINVITGDLKINNVVIRPKETPLQLYPYINSSFVLKTKRILLSRVDLYSLLKNNRLKIKRIEIEKPEISVLLNGRYHFVFPFKKDNKATDAETKSLKQYFDSYLLKEFRLTEASLTMEDEYAGKSYKVGELNISLSDIKVNQQYGVDSLSFRKADLKLNDFITKSKSGRIRLAKSKNYQLNIDSFKMEQRPDSFEYKVGNFKTQIKDWEIVTEDSVYRIGAKSVDLSRNDKSMHINELTIKPAITREDFSQLHKYQKELYSIAVKKLDLLNINFDSLNLHHKLVIGEVNLDSADVVIFRDKTKPVDLKRFPEYLGQQLDGIGIQMKINDVNVSNSALEYMEKKTDGDVASVKVRKLNLKAQNISSQMPDSLLSIKGNGFLENKVQFALSLVFSYKRPEFVFNGNLKPFEFSDLNRVIQGFGAVSVKKGVVDEITFSGNATKTGANGDMKFLYHDLELDIALKKYSNFKNSLISFAANAYLNSRNPLVPDKPARLVKYEVERDRNKGFMNLIIKSVMAGLNETLRPSKENRKVQHETKKAFRKEQKRNSLP
jgi:hypothetical protein